MKLKFDYTGCQLLHWMLAAPGQIPFHRIGDPQRPTPEYKPAKRAEALHLDRIKRRWLLGIVMELIDKEKEQYRYRPYDGSLKKVHADVLLEVVKHYEGLGKLPEYAKSYWEIRDQLEGKPLVDDDEDEEFEDKAKDATEEGQDGP